MCMFLIFQKHFVPLSSCELNVLLLLCIYYYFHFVLGGNNEAPNYSYAHQSLI